MTGSFIAVMSPVDTSFLEDLPKGPLDVYRKQASFDWKRLKVVFDEPEYLKIKVSNTPWVNRLCSFQFHLCFSCKYGELWRKIRCFNKIRYRARKK